MQKSEEERNTYAPTDALVSQVRGNCYSEKIGCEFDQGRKNLKASSVNSGVDQLSGKREQDLGVPVLNMRGEPLMPTTPAKARHLLEQDKAKVVTRKPFTIQLNHATGETKQPIILGVDAAYKEVGLSAVSNKKELFSVKVTLRTDIPKRLQDRQMYRRNRRGRLWHRKPRFDNRSKPKGWLAPSIQHKLDSHLRLVETIKKLLPITKTIIEVASFDTQKMQKPEISGIEYQQGTLQGYEVREYLLEKWGRKCAYCDKKNVPLEIEHIVPKSRGGTDRVSNLTLSCHECNQEKGNMTAEEFGHPEIQKQAEKSLKATAFMNNVRWKLVNILNCEYTYGYVTKHNRIKQGLQKSHVNDAFIIAGGTKDMERCKPYITKQVRRNNRCLQKNRKGFKPAIRKQHYQLQPNDLVRYNGKEHRVKGVHCKGSRVVLDIKKSVAIGKVKLICYGKGLFC